MGYCVICGREHDPDLHCFDTSTQAMRHLGNDDRSRLPGHDFGRIARLADRWMIKWLLVILALLVAVFGLSTLLEKMAF